MRHFDRKYLFTMFEINIFAVLTATLVSMAVGLVWYSPWACGNIWMKTVGLSNTDLERGVWHRFALGFVAQGVLLVVLTNLFVQTHTVVPSHLLVVSVTLAVLAVQAGTVIWERKSFVYFLINGVYTSAVIVGGSAIVIYWPW